MDDKWLEPGSLTWRQEEELRQLLPKGTPVMHLSRYEAAGLIHLHSPNAFWRRQPPTEKQVSFLRRRGLLREGLTRGEAAALIGEAIRQDREG